MQRILVCGGRDFEGVSAGSLVYRMLNGALDYYGEILIIQGGAKGADALAKQWAASKGVPCIEVAAPWECLGNEAGKVRNHWMLEFCNPTIVVAFPGGSGTAHMKAIAKRAGLNVYEC